MTTDLSPLLNDDVGLYDFSKAFTIEDLRQLSDASIDGLLAIIDDTTDAEISFVPDDPDADDPHAIEGEETIGWSLGHLVLHTTATCDENAALSSMLARGVNVSQRFRYEDDWKTHCRTREACIQRLEESRRIRNAYLNTWPASPHLDHFLDLPEEHPWHGQINAPAAFINGLKHEAGHVSQFHEAKRQARAAVGDE